MTQSDGRSCCDGTASYGDLTCTSNFEEDKSTSQKGAFSITASAVQFPTLQLNTAGLGWYNESIVPHYTGMAQDYFNWDYDAQKSYVPFEHNLYPSVTALTPDVLAHMYQNPLYAKIKQALGPQSGVEPKYYYGLNFVSEGDLVYLEAYHVIHIDPEYFTLLVDPKTGNFTGQILEYHDHANQLACSRAFKGTLTKYKLVQVDEVTIRFDVHFVLNDYTIYYGKKQGDVWPQLASVTWSDVVGARGKYRLPHVDNTVVADMNTEVFKSLQFKKQEDGTFVFDPTYLRADAIRDMSLVGKGMSSFAYLNARGITVNLKMKQVEHMPTMVTDAWMQDTMGCAQEA